MDDEQHWTLDYLKDLLPLDNPLLNNLFSPSSPLTPVLQTLSTLLQTLGATLLPIFTHLLDTLTTLLSESPTLVAGGILLVLAIVLLQILSFIRRVMLFWTRLAFRLLSWAAAALVLSVVWQRGVERSVRDAVVLVTRVAGWMVGVGTVWWREYERAQELRQQEG